MLRCGYGAKFVWRIHGLGSPKNPALRYSHIFKHTINQLFTTIFNIYIYTHNYIQWLWYKTYHLPSTIHHFMPSLYSLVPDNFLISIYLSIHPSIYPSNHPSILYKGQWICLWGFVSHHHRKISWRWTIPLVHPIPSWGHSGQAARCPARQTSAGLRGHSNCCRQRRWQRHVEGRSGSSWGGPPPQDMMGTWWGYVVFTKHDSMMEYGSTYVYLKLIIHVAKPIVIHPIQHPK